MHIVRASDRSAGRLHIAWIAGTDSRGGRRGCRV